MNVSTQGGFNGSLGVGNQGIAVGEALRIDVVTGGDVVYSSKESHNAANIDFSDHREVNQASFGIVQTNPNNGSVDALLTAYNVTEAEDTVDGATFVTLAHDGTADPKATITSVTVKDQTGNVIELVSNEATRRMTSQAQRSSSPSKPTSRSSSTTSRTTTSLTLPRQTTLRGERVWTASL